MEALTTKALVNRAGDAVITVFVLLAPPAVVPADTAALIAEIIYGAFVTIIAGFTVKAWDEHARAVIADILRAAVDVVAIEVRRTTVTRRVVCELAFTGVAYIIRTFIAIVALDQRTATAATGAHITRATGVPVIARV